MHHIRQLKMDLQVADPQRGMALREQAQRLLQEEILPELDRIFSDLVGEGEWLQLDQLSLSLGDLPETNWQAELRERVLEQVRALLEQARKDVLLPPGTRPAGVSLHLPEEQAWQGLRYFLLTGLKPWWAGQASPNTWLRQVTSSQPRQLLAFFRDHRDARIRVRWQLQLSPALRQQWLEAVAPFFAGSWQQGGQLLKAWYQQATAPQQAWLLPDWEARWEALPTSSLLLAEPKTEAAYFFRMLQEVISAPSAGANLIEALQEDIPSLLPQWKAETRAWVQEHFLSAHPPSFFLKPTQPPEVHKAKREAKESEVEERKGERPLRQQDDQGEEKQAPKQPEAIEKEGDNPWLAEALAEGVFVPNAGLVLLWPFLPAFFKKLKMWEGKAFASPADQQRAVLLSDFLVSGASEAEESDLLFNKFMLGYPLEESLPATFEPTPNEVAEGQDLLQSVRDHWGALGKTSVQGMQQSFLQREGRFRLEAEQGQLLVERKGVDVLLEKLPWSLGFVRLSWMDRPLYVEW
jgi:hypothetical protein